MALKPSRYTHINWSNKGCHSTLTYKNVNTTEASVHAKSCVCSIVRYVDLIRPQWIPTKSNVELDIRSTGKGNETLVTFLLFKFWSCVLWYGRITNVSENLAAFIYTQNFWPTCPPKDRGSKVLKHWYPTSLCSIAIQKPWLEPSLLWKPQITQIYYHVL
jgi:hypothetical protein